MTPRAIQNDARRLVRHAGTVAGPGSRSPLDGFRRDGCTLFCPKGCPRTIGPFGAEGGSALTGRIEETTDERVGRGGKRWRRSERRC